jgi:chemotaxis protein CheY-P-specific phosphatase CheC
MSDDHRKMLASVFCEVLENQAYLFGDPTDEAPLYPGDVVMARMEFKGPFRGSLSLALPQALCPEIAANVLGLEPDDDEAVAGAEDAFKELLNVTCGQVLTKMAGEDPVFDLTVPTVELLLEDGWKALAAQLGTVAIDIDEVPAMLCLTLE